MRNKFAFLLECRQLHTAGHYISAEGCTSMCHNWQILGDNFHHTAVF